MGGWLWWIWVPDEKWWNVSSQNIQSPQLKPSLLRAAPGVLPPLERPSKHSAQWMKTELHIIQFQNTASNEKNLQASPVKERTTINEKFKESERIQYSKYRNFCLLYFFLPRQKSNGKLFPAKVVQQANKQSWRIWENVLIKKEIDYLMYVNKWRDFHEKNLIWWGLCLSRKKDFV